MTDLPRREYSVPSTIRIGCVHVYGVSIFTKRDIIQIFSEAEGSIEDVEFLDDASCNVVFTDEIACHKSILSMTGSNLQTDGTWIDYTVPRRISQPIINSGVFVKDTSKSIVLSLRVALDSDVKDPDHHGSRDSAFYESHKAAKKRKATKQKTHDVVTPEPPLKIGSRGIMDPLTYLRASSMTCTMEPILALTEAAERKKAELLISTIREQPKLPAPLYKFCIAHQLPYRVFSLQRSFRSLKFDTACTDPWADFLNLNGIDQSALVHVLYFATSTGRLVALVPHHSERGKIDQSLLPGNTVQVKLAVMQKELNLPTFVCPPFAHQALAKDKELGTIEYVVDASVLEKAQCVFDLGSIALRIAGSDLSRLQNFSVIQNLWKPDVS